MLFAYKVAYNTFMRVSYKRQELLTLRECLSSPSDFGKICAA
jgi:hypothetical protein